MTFARNEFRPNERQERFVVALIEGKTRREAVRAAGYEVANDEAADSRASELMRNPKVYGFYVDQRAKIAAVAVMDAVKWIEYLRLIVVEAISEGEWTGAVAAMREIGRHLGVYEIDHRQRKMGPEDVEAIRAKLVAAGMNFERTNAPAHLKLNPPKPLTGTNGTNGSAP